MRHILQGVEILVFGGDFNATAPTAGAIVIQAARVWNGGAINPDLVVMETFILGSSDADPGTVRLLGQRVAGGTDIELDGLGLGCNDAGADAAFRIDLGILFALLVGGRRLPVICWLVALGHAKRARQQSRRRE